ncbi:type I-D CRISPR-associated helicase Cas3' [Cyanobacteria bacterium FACHB-63]|nr:type I-D CRISPR-associated helicase Cas3' [Cyanobacteria bacterium FACHB-63]
MKVFLQPLYSRLNPGIGNCSLGCEQKCRIIEAAPDFQPALGYTCPLSVHQAETYAAVTTGDADIIFNTATTGDGKSLASYLPGLLAGSIRIMGLYPTIELVEDQTRSQREYHEKFNLDADSRIDRLFGQELSRRVEASASNRYQELRLTIENSPIILTNPDIFHLITHFQYQDLAYGIVDLPLLLAEFPDLWVADEFHIFGAHQEAAMLNSLSFIRRSQQRKRRFLFTSATPKEKFIQQLQAAGLKTKIIPGHYANQPESGYRQILQAIELEFVQLKRQDTLDWLQANIADIQTALTSESPGRGLIILNSVAQTGRVVRLLRELMPDVQVEEISGRMDRASREKTQGALQSSDRPVLVVGTSAVDVGVDFRIHLLIFESSDSATVIQRLGRLGRHPGFNWYRAIALLPSHAPWIYEELKNHLEDQASVPRETLRDAVLAAFDSPNEFEDYRKEWGALQAQGMLWNMSQKNRAVMAPVRDRILEDLQPIYGVSELETARKRWAALGHSETGRATQSELLRFRGGTALQAAVWDENRFYTYDLLRLLPYTLVEIMEQDEFLQIANQHGHPAYTFQYAQVFLKIRRWMDERIDIALRCDRDSSELMCCDLILLKSFRLVNHPQAEVLNCLSRKQILSFLIPVDSKNPASHWEVGKMLKLTPLFSLYRLVDSSEQSYACAFNQDALLLKSLRRKLTKLCRYSSTSLIF